MISASEITLETARGQTRFTVRQMDGVTAGKIMLRMGKSLGPALSSAMNKFKAGDKLGAFAELLSAVDSEQFDIIQSVTMRGLIAITGDEVDTNAEKKLGEIFTGHVAELFELLIFALKINYTSFFEKLRGAGGDLPKI